MDYGRIKGREDGITFTGGGACIDIAHTDKDTYARGATTVTFRSGKGTSGIFLGNPQGYNQSDDGTDATRIKHRLPAGAEFPGQCRKG